MPQVPTYDGPQVRAQPLRPVYQSDVDVSSGAQALARGLGAVSEVADRIGERDAQVKAETVDTQISTEWLKWDAENRRKYQGENAPAYTAAAEEWWKKASETYGKDLDPRAKALASRSLVRKQGAAMGNVVQFVGAEQERHADDVNAASVASAIQFGISTGDVAGSAEQLRNMAAAKGARKGWTTEQVQAEQLKNLSGLHLAQITKLAEQDPTKAQAYYDANKVEISASAQPRVEEVLKKEADNQFATQFAAQQAGKPLSEQLAAAGEIKDPQKREKALVEIKNNHAMVEQAKRETEAKFSDQAWQLFSQGKKIPEAVLAGMDGRERAQLQESQRARADRAVAGHPVKTDWATYIDTREKLARGEKVDLRGLTEKIGPTQMEQLIDIQTSAAKGGSAKQDSMLTDEQRINTALVGMGVNKTKDPETAALVTTEIDRRVRQASLAKGGKDLTADEKQKVVDSVVLDKVYVDAWGPDSQKPVAMLKPEEMAKAYVNVNGKNVPVSSVPSTDRLQIIAALKATGLPVSEQNIVQMFVDGKNKNVSKGQVK
jgi:hypothetical protein